MMPAPQRRPASDVSLFTRRVAVSGAEAPPAGRLALGHGGRAAPDLAGAAPPRRAV